MEDGRTSSLKHAKRWSIVGAAARPFTAARLWPVVARGGALLCVVLKGTVVLLDVMV